MSGFALASHLEGAFPLVSPTRVSKSSTSNPEKCTCTHTHTHHTHTETDPTPAPENRASHLHSDRSSRRCLRQLLGTPGSELHVSVPLPTSKDQWTERLSRVLVALTTACSLYSPTLLKLEPDPKLLLNRPHSNSFS